MISLVRREPFRQVRMTVSPWSSACTSVGRAASISAGSIVGEVPCVDVSGAEMGVRLSPEAPEAATATAAIISVTTAAAGRAHRHLA